MVSSTCSLGVWLKAKVFGHGKDGVASLGYILGQPFLQGQHSEKNVTTWLKAMLVWKYTWCGFLWFHSFFFFSHIIRLILISLSFGHALLKNRVLWKVACPFLEYIQIINITPFKFQEDILGTKEKLAWIFFCMWYNDCIPWLEETLRRPAYAHAFYLAPIFLTWIH